MLRPQSRWHLTTHVKAPGLCEGGLPRPGAKPDPGRPLCAGGGVWAGRGSRPGSGHGGLPHLPARSASEHSPPQVSLHLRQLPLQRQHLQGRSAVGLPPPSLPLPELCGASSAPCHPLQLNPPLTQGKRQIRSQRTFSLHAARRRPCPQQQHVCEAQKQASDHGCPHNDTVMSPGPLPHDSGRAVTQHTWTIMDVTMLSKARD